MRGLYMTAVVLVIIGGLNWGLVGFFDWNLVDAIFGEGSALSRIIYAIVGLAALYMIIARLMRPADKPAEKRTA
jgi:uncharacterized membrane protein YuzA (DUF378 family)